MVTTLVRSWCGSSLASRSVVVLALAFQLVPATTPRAQCPLQLLAELPVAGTTGEVLCSHPWDPDGPGPRTAVVVLGGQFTVAGSVPANNIVTWDPATGAMAPLGAGLHGIVRALAVTAAGELIAGGEIDHSGPTSLDNLARWNGSAWLPLGAAWGPMTGGVDALLAMPNGDLWVGGSMVIPISATANLWYLVCWNGASFLPPGASVNGAVRSFARTASGALVVGGEFALAGGLPASGIAQWDGTTWSTFGSGLGGTGRVANAVLCLPNGDVVAGGRFTSAGGVAATNVARWNGSTWAPLAIGIGKLVTSLAALPTGEVLAGTTSSSPTQEVVQWDGATWTVAGTVLGSKVQSLRVVPSLGCVATGDFTVVDAVGAAGVAVRGTAGWAPLVTGALGIVRCSALLPNGDLVVGGEFQVMGVAARNIARRTAGTWEALGGGLDGVVRAVAALPGGDIVAGGSFTTAGSVAARNIARWDGTSWSPLDAGLGSPGQTVHALAVLAGGELVAGGDFAGAVARLARWDGVAWQPFGSPTTQVRTLLVTANGELLAGGVPGSIGGATTSGLARWDGSTWLGIGPGAIVLDVAEGPGGTIVAVTASNQVMRWSPGWWTTFGQAWGVQTVAFAPNGDVLIGGSFSTVSSIQSVLAGRIARWRAATGTWEPVAGGMDPGGTGVHELRLLSDDAMLVGGAFTIVDGVGGAALARVRVPCPPVVATYGAGCAGLAGVNTLQALTEPWLGTTFRSLATGLPANGFALGVLGGAPLALPIAALTPLGGAGCDLLVSMDVTSTYVLAAGAVVLDVPIPNAPTLIGGTFHEQVVVAEVDASGAITRFTSSNAVTATIGSW